ncbi:MAG: hypothetical protein IPL96_11405 [Holophagaceae bacterium]|nr:hypothetical protein [Holophagaceae bacterium]
MPLSMPFLRGQLVVAVLHNPRQKFWGRILGLEAAGLVIRGVDLAPWEEILSLVKNGQADQVALGTRYVPLHRVESVYLDEPSSGAQSLGQGFQDRTGIDPQVFLADPLPPGLARKARR